MTTRSRRTIWVLLALVLLSIGGWLFLTERPLSVPIVTAEQGTRVRVFGLGTVEARIVSKVGFEVGGALADLLVDSNDAVTKGEVLARLNPAAQQASVARAKAGVVAADAAVLKATANVDRAMAILAQSRTTNARQQELATRNVVSATSTEQTKSDVEVSAADLAVAQSDVAVVTAQAADARAALSGAQTLLDQHVLAAPFDGVVVDRRAEAGTVVKAGDVIFTLMDPKTVWVQSYIDEGRAGDLALGQVVEIRLRSLPHQVFTGTVARIGIESDRVNEERTVWVACSNCPARMYLGEQAEVWITVAILGRALLVPETAIEGFDGHHGRVWVVQNGRLSQVPLIFGHRTEDARVEVVSGLPDGARIVASPIKGLAKGRLARIAGDAP